MLSLFNLGTDAFVLGFSIDSSLNFFVSASTPGGGGVSEKKYFHPYPSIYKYQRIPHRTPVIKRSQRKIGDGPV
jgi:hypothetical protein